MPPLLFTAFFTCLKIPVQREENVTFTAVTVIDQEDTTQPSNQIKCLLGRIKLS